MTHISKSALLPYTAKEMYDLVNDVAAYPGFMDGCLEANVREQSDGHMVAELVLSKAGIKQSFTTRNTLTPHDEIILELVEGPFTRLKGFWRFQALTEQACKVTFDLEFEADKAILRKALDKLFNSVASSLVVSLEERAKVLYGKRI